MNLGDIEQRLFISHYRGGFLNTETFCVHKKHGQDQRKGKDNTTNPIKMLVC